MVERRQTDAASPSSPLRGSTQSDVTLGAARSRSAHRKRIAFLQEKRHINATTRNGPPLRLNSSTTFCLKNAAFLLENRRHPAKKTEAEVVGNTGNAPLSRERRRRTQRLPSTSTFSPVSTSVVPPFVVKKSGVCSVPSSLSAISSSLPPSLSLLWSSLQPWA